MFCPSSVAIRMKATTMTTMSKCDDDDDDEQ
jgi:hypothetical protein